MNVDLKGKIITLSDEQLALFDQLTKLGKAYVLEKLKGKTNVDAYVDAGGGVKSSQKIRESSASQMANKPEVQAFIDSFIGVAITNSIMTRDEMLTDLTDIARVTIDDLVEFEDSPCVDMNRGNQVFMSRTRIKGIDEVPAAARKAIKSVKQTKHGLEVVLHDGLAARKQISDLMGYDSPKQLEVGAASLTLSHFYADMKKQYGPGEDDGGNS